MLLLDFISKLFELRFSMSTSCFSKFFNHRLNQERAAATALVQHNILESNVYDLTHKIGDMVGCKRLVLICLTNVFIKRDKEQVENVLTFRRISINIAIDIHENIGKDFDPLLLCKRLNFLVIKNIALK